ENPEEPTQAFRGNLLDGPDPAAAWKAAGSAGDVGNGGRPEKGIVRRSRVPRFPARRDRRPSGGHQASDDRTQIEAQRAGAFSDRRGLLRRGTAAPRHPAFEKGHEIGSAVW